MTASGRPVEEPSRAALEVEFWCGIFRRAQAATLDGSWFQGTARRETKSQSCRGDSDSELVLLLLPFLCCADFFLSCSFNRQRFSKSQATFLHAPRKSSSPPSFPHHRHHPPPRPFFHPATQEKKKEKKQTTLTTTPTAIPSPPRTKSTLFRPNGFPVVPRRSSSVTATQTLGPRDLAPLPPWRNPLSAANGRRSSLRKG